MMYNSERLGKLLKVTQLIGAQEQVCLIINQYHFFFFFLSSHFYWVLIMVVTVLNSLVLFNPSDILYVVGIILYEVDIIIPNT